MSNRHQDGLPAQHARRVLAWLDGDMEPIAPTSSIRALAEGAIQSHGKLRVWRCTKCSGMPPMSPVKPDHCQFCGFPHTHEALGEPLGELRDGGVWQ